MLAREADIVFIDFETTGVVAGYPTQPWQVGLAFLSQGRIVREHLFSSLIQIQDRPFNPYAPGRHATLRAELTTAPTMTDLWPTLNCWLCSRPLGAHNAGVEKAVLADAYPLHRFAPWIDTLSLVRIAYPNHQGHKLEDLLSDLKLAPRVQDLCPDLAPHDALFDAVAAAALLEHLLNQNGWSDVTIEELVESKPRSFFRQRSQKRRTV